MNHPISSLLLVLTSLYGPALCFGADLVLSQHYTAIEVSRDDAMYTGEDGLVIHPGDHYHDPCDNYQEGVKFTTTGKSEEGQADGFLVVNDCRITKCRKWMTPDGEWGGETIVYDILPVSNNDTRTFVHWSVLEETTCSCGEDCYVGKFLHVDDDRVKSGKDRNYDNVCEAMGGASPGSISCEAPKGWKEHILTSTKNKDPWAIVGIVAASVVAYAIICCCCYYCFRRKKNQVTNEEPEEPEKDSLNILPVAGSKTEEESSQSSKKKTRWFGKKANKETVAMELPVAGSETEEESSQSSKKKTRWFGKKANKETVAMEKVEKKQSVDEQEQGLAIVGTASKDMETGSVNTQAFNCSDCCMFG